MVPDKFNMVDMEGIDILFSYGDTIPGLYQKLVESIAQCRYQCLYNWYFDGVLIPPTYVEMTVIDNKVWIGDGVSIDEEDTLGFTVLALKNVIARVVRITDALVREVNQIVCHINPLQSGSGNPSPTNIRNITGWTGVKVERSGKNLFNKNDPNMIRGAYFNRSGTIGTNANYGISYVPINPGDKLVYSGLKGANGNPCGIQFFDANKTFLAMGDPEAQQNNVYVTAPSGAAYIGISVFYTNNVAYKDIDTAQLEIGTAASEYEAYQGTTLPINWQTSVGTIYGCSVTLNDDGSGKLTVTDGEIASYNGEILPSTWISDRDVYAPGTTPTIGAQVVYKLAEPLIYDLTVQHLPTLLQGKNNIWHDANGDISVTYWYNKF